MVRLQAGSEEVETVVRSAAESSRDMDREANEQGRLIGC
jgi:hypothetical protein